MADPHHVVVDGSNLATEGRTLPSLRQLDEAVRAYAAEDPGSHIVVVVDATFEHRVSEEERAEVREAMLNGELVSPPAGAIGRGDAFVLRIAERTGAIVLSNDSFQEFHGEHPWLFDEGRLVGGKPVPGVGWIFTPRLPIRGPKSRAATAQAKAKADPSSAPAKAAELARAARKADKKGDRAKVLSHHEPVEMTWPLVPSVPPPGRPKVDPVFSSAVDEAIAEVLQPPPPPKPTAKTAAKAKSAAKKHAGVAKDGRAETARTQPPSASEPAPAVAAAGGGSPTRSGRGKKKQSTPPPAVNEPLAFIRFVAAYPVGTTVEGEVVSFTSHGAMVDVALPGGGVLDCYIPLTAMGTPPPTKARQVLAKGEVRSFVLAGLDPPRRVAELALPEAVVAAGADGAGPRQPAAPERTTVSKQRASKPPAVKRATVKQAAPATSAPTKVAPKKAGVKKAGAPKKPATEKASTKKASTKRAPGSKKAATKKAATKKAAEKVAGPKKAGSKTAAAKKVATKTSVTKKSATKKSATKKSATGKEPAPTKVAPRKATKPAAKAVKVAKVTAAPGSTLP